MHDVPEIPESRLYTFMDETCCTLVPGTFREFPTAMFGLVRLQKVFPGNRPPYESVLEARGLPLGEIVNRVLAGSFQMASSVRVSRSSDQSVLIHRLPALAEHDRYDDSADAVRQRFAELDDRLRRVLDRALTAGDEIRETFAGHGFQLLASRPVRFRCNCSGPRMIANVRSLGEETWRGFFDPGQESIEIVCEYCKHAYRITREDLEGPRGRPN